MYFLVLLGMGCEGVGRVFSCGKRMIVNKAISEIKCKMGRGKRERERESNCDINCNDTRKRGN